MAEYLNKAQKDGGGFVYTAARDDGTGKPVTDVQLTGSTVEEQLTESDAVSGTLTFAENIQYIDIYNRDATNDGVFTVNGIALTVPPERSTDIIRVGGTPSTDITVSGSTSYIVTRLV